ncbi:MAG: hypothetical protein ACRC0G_08945 [Fusobacteriaceae bacterium]
MVLKKDFQKALKDALKFNKGTLYQEGLQLVVNANGLYVNSTNGFYFYSNNIDDEKREEKEVVVSKSTVKDIINNLKTSTEKEVNVIFSDGLIINNISYAVETEKYPPVLKIIDVNKLTARSFILEKSFFNSAIESDLKEAKKCLKENNNIILSGIEQKNQIVFKLEFGILKYRAFQEKRMIETKENSPYHSDCTFSLNYAFLKDCYTCNNSNEIHFNGNNTLFQIRSERIATGLMPLASLCVV